MEAFDNEVEIWKGLEHENIVSLHRTFRDHSFMYLVCEHIEGGSLFDEIVGHKVYGEEQARNIMKQVSKTNKTFQALLQFCVELFIVLKQLSGFFMGWW